MRRLAGLVLVAVGAALIVLALALPSYVYPRVAKVPANPNQTMTSRGSGLTVLLPRAQEAGGTRILTGQSVTSVSRVIGQTPPDGTSLPAGDAFYQLAFSVTVEGQGLLQASVEGGSFDGRSGLAVNRGGDYYTTDPNAAANSPVHHQGLLFKFPFDTQRTNYPFWDPNIGRAVSARYDGTEVIDGLRTYRFVQPITGLVIGRQPVPGALIGQPGRSSVTADRIYSTIRTLWVEPYTGAIIKGSERVDQRLAAGGRQIPIISGTIGFTDATVAALVASYRPLAGQLRFVRRTGPVAGWILGPIIVLLGLALLVLVPAEPEQRSGPGPEGADEDRSPRDELAAQSAPGPP